MDALRLGGCDIMRVSKRGLHTVGDRFFISKARGNSDHKKNIIKLRTAECLMTKLTNEERLVTLEVKLDAVMQTLERIDERLEKTEKRYVTREKHQDDLKDLFREIEINRKKLNKFWIQNTLSAILGSVMTFLVISYLSSGL